MSLVLFMGVFCLAEQTLILKLNDGSDIIPALEKLAKDKAINYGFIESGCGKLKDFEIISHEQKGSVNRTLFKQQFELDAISGKIQRTKESGFTIIVRVSVSSTGFTPKAGQLISGKAAGCLELGIRKVDLKKIIEA